MLKMGMLTITEIEFLGLSLVTDRNIDNNSPPQAAEKKLGKTFTGQTHLNGRAVDCVRGSSD